MRTPITPKNTLRTHGKLPTSTLAICDGPVETLILEQIDARVYRLGFKLEFLAAANQPLPSGTFSAACRPILIDLCRAVRSRDNRDLLYVNGFIDDDLDTTTKHRFCGCYDLSTHQGELTFQTTGTPQRLSK